MANNISDYISSMPTEVLLKTLLLKYPSLAQMLLRNNEPIISNPSLLEKFLMFLNLAEKQYVKQQDNVAEKGMIR